MSRWREKGVLEVGGLHYAVHCEGATGRAFVLSRDATELARAEKTGWLSRSFTVNHGERTYRLEQQWFGRSFFLLDNGREVGSVVPRGMVTRKASVSLPDELPMPVRIFVIWLTVILKKRDADAAAITAGA